MATREDCVLPIGPVESLLSKIGSVSNPYDIELARIIAVKHGINRKRVAAFLGLQTIIVDPIFLHERVILSKNLNVYTKFIMWLHSREIPDSNLKALLQITGHGLYVRERR